MTVRNTLATTTRRLTCLVIVLSVFALAGCGGGDDTPTTPTGPTTAAAYTERGWERFEAGEFADALTDFEAAIVKDATYGEAHAGRGWTLLVQAAPPLAMREAAAAFGDALARGENGPYVWAGRASAWLGAGGAYLDDAEDDANMALSANEVFEFSHRPSFDVLDLKLIVAFSLAARGNFTGALAEADGVLDSGIDAASPATWQVDGTTYDVFPGAVLAHLFKVSEQFSG